MHYQRSLVIVAALAACGSPPPEAGRGPLERDSALESVCTPAQEKPPAEWSPLVLPQPGGRLCANTASLPEWKSGLEIYHRGELLPIRDAYIAAAAAAGWTKVHIDENKERGRFMVLLHRADGSHAITFHISKILDLVRVSAQRLRWEDQVRRSQEETNSKVEESLRRAGTAP